MISRNTKYPMLTTVANLLIVSGFVLVGIGAIAAFYGLVTIGRGFGSALTLLVGLIAVIIGLLGTAAGESIGVAFDIESNTRNLSVASKSPNATS